MQEKEKVAMRNTAKPEDVKRLEAFLQQHPEVAHVDAVFFDINGVARGKRVPREHAGKLYAGGLTLPRSLFVLDVLGDVSNGLGVGLTDGDPDGVGVPLQGDALLTPWTRQPCAQLLMDMVEPDGSAVWFNPRYQLGLVVEKFASLGLVPVCAVEMEFYLIDPKRRGEGGQPLAPVSPLTEERERHARVYDLEDLESYGVFFERLDKIASALCLPLSASSTEFAPGQFEVNLTHGKDPLLAGDHACLLRQAVVQTARLCGMEATFLSKPFAKETGNGMHIHLSILDNNGKNIFQSKDAYGTVALREAVRGMQKLMAESLAVFAPHINAYRRLGSGGFAPFVRDWSYNNRLTALRIPAGKEESKRIEHRMAGADANPYLVLACVLAGALEGLADGIEAESPLEAGTPHAQTSDLPPNLPAALEVFENGTRLREYLQPEYLELYASVKRGEYERFMGEAFEREFSWYL